MTISNKKAKVGVIAMVALAGTLGVMAMAGCSSGGGPAASSTPASSAATSSAATSSAAATASSSAKTYKAGSGKITTTPADVSFNNYEYFDFADDIKKEIGEKALVPAAADVAIAVADANGATGVQLVPASEGSDLYLNAMVNGSELIITATKGEIAHATSSAQGDLAVEGGKVGFVPVTLHAVNPTDEVITVKMKDDTSFTIHTVPEFLPNIEIPFQNVAPEDAGVYTWQEYGWLMRVDTDGDFIYYRDLNCSVPGAAGRLGNMNFQPHETPDGMFYSYAIAIGAFGGEGASEDFFTIMDENYVEIDTVTLMPNDSANHKHGEGYLDFHEIRVLGPENYIVMGYDRLKVKLPESLEGVDKDNTAFVKATFLQQQKDNEVVWEICSADHPILFENSSEGCDYAASVENKTYADYMHCNAMDWLEDGNGNVTKVMTSFRNHEALVQFDVTDGDAAVIDWIYNGKASTLKLDADYTEMRTDLFGNEFESAEWGQHCCRYSNKDPKTNMIPKGEDMLISVFDNDTGTKRPFTTMGEGAEPTLTRTYQFTINDEGVTKMQDVCDGTHYMELDKAAHGDYTSYYFGHHCSSVFYQSPTSVFTGWGMGVGDKNAPDNPIIDENYPNLKLVNGVTPVLTDYNPIADEITFELHCTPKKAGETGYAYRAYKTVE